MYEGKMVHFYLIIIIKDLLNCEEKRKKKKEPQEKGRVKKKNDKYNYTIYRRSYYSTRDGSECDRCVRARISLLIKKKKKSSLRKSMLRGSRSLRREAFEGANQCVKRLPSYYYFGSVFLFCWYTAHSLQQDFSPYQVLHTA